MGLKFALKKKRQKPAEQGSKPKCRLQSVREVVDLQMVYRLMFLPVSGYGSDDGVGVLSMVLVMDDGGDIFLGWIELMIELNADELLFADLW